MRMQTSAPTRKVMASTLATAIVTILLWIMRSAFPELAIPPAVEAAITTIVVFIVGYFTPPAMRDQVVETA